MENGKRTRSWHCTMKNPYNYGFKGDVKEIMNYICNKWDKPDKNMSVVILYYCYDDGTNQYRMVFQSDKLMRISALKKRYPLLFETVEPASRHSSYKFLHNECENGHGRYVAKGYLSLSGTYYDNLSLGEYEYVN